MTLIQIEKALLDKREHKYIELENLARVILISDSSVSTDENAQSAAALCINVGSFSDPNEAQGLAHFLEHMVFMGSEKYPNENDFDAFVSRRGGHYNAFTQNEMTTFFFSVNSNGFSKSFDRFINFFVKPLLKVDAVDREINAVDNGSWIYITYSLIEFEMATKKDIVRFNAILNSLSKDNSPTQVFSYGNKISLQQIPIENNTNVYELLKQFRLDHYSSNRMTIAVISNHSIEDLEELVRKSCQNLYQNSLSQTKQFLVKSPYDTDKFRGFLKIFPILDSDEVLISWPLPSQRQYIDSFPAKIISNFLAQEGSGSLGAFLRRAGLIHEIFSSSDITDDHNASSFYHIISVQIKLTDKGFGQIDRIVDAVCSYMEMVKLAMNPVSPNQELVRFLNEVKQLNDIKTKYAKVGEPDNVVTNLVQMLHILPREQSHRVYNAFLQIRNLDIQTYYNTMNKYVHPRNMNVTIRSIKFTPDFANGWTKEKWFEAEYCLESFSEDQLTRWSLYSLVSQFSIPKKNEFIPSNFTLLPAQDDNKFSVDLNSVMPNRTDKKRFGKLWHCQVTKFEDPRTNLRLMLSNSYGRKSVKNCVLLSIWIHAMQQLVSDQFYEALETSDSLVTNAIQQSSWSLIFDFTHFSDKLQVFFENILKACLAEPIIIGSECEKSSFESQDFVLTEKKFIEYCSFIKQSVFNSSLKPNKLINELHYFITSGHFTSQQKRDVIDTLTLNDLIEFRKKFLSSTFIQMAVTGNFDKQRSLSCFDFLVNLLNEAKPLDKYELRPIYKPIPGFHRLRVLNRDLNSRNTYSVLFIKVNPFYFENLELKWKEERENGTHSALADSFTPFFYAKLLNELLQIFLMEPCFNYLRTLKCLGYSVSVAAHEYQDGPTIDVNTKYYLGILVSSSSQTNHHDLNKVSGLVVAFWRRAMPCILNCLSDDDFQTQIQSLVEEYKVPKLSLDELASGFHDEMIKGSWDFNYRELSANILEKVTRQNFEEFVQMAFLDINNAPTLLLIEADGSKLTAGKEEETKQDSNARIEYNFFNLSETDNDELLSIEAKADIEMSHECAYNNTSDSSKKRRKSLNITPMESIRPKLWFNHLDLMNSFLEYNA